MRKVARYRWLSLVLAAGLCLGPSRPARAFDGASPLDWPSVFTRLQNLTANQLNELGQSALALTAAITTLWNFKANLKSIKQGALDVWRFRQNRKAYLEAQRQLDKFNRSIMREISSRPDSLVYERPSLLQLFAGHLRLWMETVDAIDAHATKVLGAREDAEPPSYQEIRRELALHFHDGLYNEVAGMRYYPAVKELEAAVGVWEREGDLTGVETWVDREVTSKEYSKLGHEASGRKWVKRYVELTLKLAAAEWLEARTTLRLQEWWRNNQASLSDDQKAWWKELETLAEKETKAARLFTAEYNNLIAQLNRASAGMGKRYPVAIYIPEKRDLGLIHGEEEGIETVFLASEMSSRFKDHCGDALAAFQAARDVAAGKGTWTGMGLLVTTKIFTPAALLVTGVTTAILAYNGFHDLVRKVIWGP